MLKDMPHLLLIDNNPAIIRSFGEFLTENTFNVITATTSEQALKAIEEIHGPVVILLDRFLKNNNGDLVLGEDLLPELAEHSFFKPLTITISEDDSYSAEIAMIKAGSTWYLPKSKAQYLLLPYVWLAIHTIQDLIQLKLDPLTQTLNRQAMFDVVALELYRASRSKESMACIMFDIDKLKPVNDIYGHLVGDEIIKGVVNSINEHSRVHTDIICRYGGDEILVFLFGIKEDDVKRFIYESSKAITSKKVLIYQDDMGSEYVTISASVGFSMITFEDIDRVLTNQTNQTSHSKRTRLFRILTDKAIKKADKQMYAHKKAKKDSRNILSAPVTVSREK